MLARLPTVLAVEAFGSTGYCFVCLLAFAAIWYAANLNRRAAVVVARQNTDRLGNRLLQSIL